MKYSLAIAAIAGAATVLAGPIVERQAAITDVDILNYALTLEHLEDTFYRQGLANYTQAQFVAAGFADPFYDNLKTIGTDEAAHVKFLSDALGAAAVKECVYDFGVSTPAQFVALASVLEGVGVSAYLGAASSIANKDYLTAAGSILTVEARHSAYVRQSLNQSPFPQPFDVPLTFDEVYTLAAPFIKSCPQSNGKLPVKAFPALGLGTSGPIVTGTVITLTTGNYKFVGANGGPIYACFLYVTGPICQVATPVATGFTVPVPKGVNGQSYVVLTGCNTTVTDDTVVAGPAIVEISNKSGN